MVGMYHNFLPKAQQTTNTNTIMDPQDYKNKTTTAKMGASTEQKALQSN